MGPISEWFRQHSASCQVAKRLTKIHSAPPPHKSPKVGYTWAFQTQSRSDRAPREHVQGTRAAPDPPRLPGVAQTGGNTGDTNQQSLLQRAVGLAITQSGACQQLGLEQVQGV